MACHPRTRGHCLAAPESPPALSPFLSLAWLPPPPSLPPVAPAELVEEAAPAGEAAVVSSP